MSEESPSYSRVWGPIVHAMVQSGASGQEWAVLVALLRWQREGSNVLSMSVPTICKYTGLDEDTVRHRLSSLSKRYFVSAGGNEFPILEVIKPAGKGGRAGRLYTPSACPVWGPRTDRTCSRAKSASSGKRDAGVTTTYDVFVIRSFQ